MSLSGHSWFFAGFVVIVVIMTLMTLIGFGVFGLTARRIFREAERRRSQPPEFRPARVVAKRTEVRGMDSTATWYYATFEFETGERRELSLPGADYGLLAEGDEGRVGFQGTWFHSFERQAAAAPPVLLAAKANS